MWWIYALLSALFAALTAKFAKMGIRGIDAHLALVQYASQSVQLY